MSAAKHTPGLTRDQVLAQFAADVIATHERIRGAAQAMLAALQAEEEWRRRDEDGAIDPEWDYERMVGDLRRAAIAKATGGAA